MRSFVGLKLVCAGFFIPLQGIFSNKGSYANLIQYISFKFIDVVKAYHAQGNPFARNPARYSLGDYRLDDAVDLASRLYYSGRIHQPRTFNSKGVDPHYVHPAKLGHGLWMQVVPTIDNTTPAVVEAYEKYKMLDTLTK